MSSFFIESFQIPPFLLPIYQAAGTAYGIPWQVLAAINEVETDYGRDLSVSSAGAEGWMQFLPAEWAEYGVDANGDGFKDPYNPADAIFTAARYLKAAGGDTDIRGAVFSYNHSQAYVESVMLRAQLLGGTPAQLLGAVTGLTEARFPVHAPSHYSDGFATVPASSGSVHRRAEDARRDDDLLPAGRACDRRAGRGNRRVGRNPLAGALRGPARRLRQHLHLRRARQRGDALPGARAARAHRCQHADRRVGRVERTGAERPGQRGRAAPLAAVRRRHRLPAGARRGSDPGSPVGHCGDRAGCLRPRLPLPSRRKPRGSSARAPTRSTCTRLSVGVQVLAGTVLGHVGAGTSAAGSTGGAGTGTAGAAGAGEPHMLFQIRPAGVDAPLIDPKPILDGWVQLENTSVFRAKGENPFLGNSPTVGQVLLETKEQLEQQVLSDPGIHLPACGRQDVQTGQVDRRVLATLEFLSVSGLHPTVSSLRCSHVACSRRRQRRRDGGRRRGRDHGRQRHPDRRPSEPGLDRRRSRSTSCRCCRAR